MASTSTDHTVNKIALYSALFAGVAYVGYSYVKDSLGKPRKHKKGKNFIGLQSSTGFRIFNVIFGANIWRFVLLIQV